MADLRRPRIAKIPQVSAQWIKTAAAILLVAANAGAILVEKGIIGMDGYSMSELLTSMENSSGMTGLVGAAVLARLLNGIAIPLFAFLLAEGFRHTRNVRRYLAALTVTALVSEPIYDFAMTGTPLDFSAQNPMLALVIGLLVLILMDWLNRFDKTEQVIGRILLTLGGLFWVTVLRIPYGIETVLIISVWDSFRGHHAVRMIVSILVSLVEPTGPLAFCAIGYYSGERKLKLSKYLFYALYPAHLLLLGVVRYVFLK